MGPSLLTVALDAWKLAESHPCTSPDKHIVDMMDANRLPAADLLFLSLSPFLARNHHQIALSEPVTLKGYRKPCEHIAVISAKGHPRVVHDRLLALQGYSVRALPSFSFPIRSSPQPEPRSPKALR